MSVFRRVRSDRATTSVEARVDELVATVAV
jgi:hypothetical protein